MHILICMVKTHTSLSVDSWLLEESKKKKVNMSETLHWALLSKIGKAEEVEKSGAFPFDFCERSIPEHFKETLFGCAGIKARRCAKCNKIWFVNDIHREFTVCKECWEVKKKE